MTLISGSAAITTGLVMGNLDSEIGVEVVSLYFSTEGTNLLSGTYDTEVHFFAPREFGSARAQHTRIPGQIVVQ